MHVVSRRYAFEYVLFDVRVGERLYHIEDTCRVEVDPVETHRFEVVVKEASH